MIFLVWSAEGGNILYGVIFLDLFIYLFDVFLSKVIYFQGFNLSKKHGWLLLKILRKKLFSFRSGLTEGFGPSLKNF